MLPFFFLLLCSLVVGIDQVTRQQQGSQFYLYFFIPFTCYMDRDFHIGLLCRIDQLSISVFLIVFMVCLTYFIEKENYKSPSSHVFDKPLISLKLNLQRLTDSGLCRFKEPKKSCSTAVQRGVMRGYWCFSQRDEVIQRARTRAIGFFCQSSSEKVLGTLIWKVKLRPECTNSLNPLSYWGHIEVKQRYWQGAEGLCFLNAGPTFCCFQLHEPGMASEKDNKYMCIYTYIYLHIYMYIYIYTHIQYIQYREVKQISF